MEKGINLLFEDKYCRIFDVTKQEILQAEMRGKTTQVLPDQ